MIKQAKRGRPPKKQILPGIKVNKFTPKLVKMDNLSFNEDLFIPMKTNKKIDALLSSEGGLMKGTNFAFI